jgi:hypothetical protein
MEALQRYLPDHSDNQATIFTTTCIRRRQYLDPNVARRYWRDIHGLLFARVSGFRHYAQVHLTAPVSDFLPLLPEIEHP